ncbi:LysR family transcriptional regulator [Cohnella hongkongensis]|uniref:LysR family transcriptional regulator n=1 Tax=Cohnella hongkongensis TaxID=178337 RepID=A0ABV9FFQ5_9BACL
MNVQQLKVFLSVCDGHTLLETADKLGLKQPTVSFHLRKLEEALGLSLWRRNARGFQPTSDAYELLPYARRIVMLVDEADERMSELRSRQGGRLRIGASHTPATYFIPRHLAQFRSLHPDVQLLLTVKKASSTLAMLRSYEIDAAIVSLPEKLREDEGLVLYRLAEDGLRLFLSPEHPLAASREIEVEQLLQETFLLHESGTTSRQLTDEWAQQVGLRLDSAMEMGAIETIKAGLKCNMGIAVLPWRSAIRETQSGELIQRSLPRYRNNRFICLALRDEETLSPHLRKFLSFARSNMAALPE